jgi:hypothetical protein
MTTKQKTSSEIFADFTISRIDEEVRSGFSSEQLDAIRRALVANESFSRHRVDIRGTLPLFFAKYYFVILAGRDRRRKTLEKEMARSHKGNLELGYFLSFLLLSLVVLVVWGIMFSVFYWLKMEMGIDVFPHLHLNDLFKASG